MDDRFEDQLGAAARDYHEPPETPREAMWARILAARGGIADVAEAAGTAGTAGTAVIAEAPNNLGVPQVLSIGDGRSVRSFRNVRSFRHVRFAAGIAAILALGVGLGRWTADRAGSPSKPVATAVEPPRTNATAYRLATTEHLSQSEAFLTLFRASVRGQANERLASATASQLLATNRLLLDSPAAGDARMRLLLQDLELVLAEIAQLSPSPRRRDLDLITEGLEEGGVLSRLRTAVPAGASVTQGAL